MGANVRPLRRSGDLSMPACRVKRPAAATCRAQCRTVRRSVGEPPRMSISRQRGAACVEERPKDCFAACLRLRVVPLGAPLTRRCAIGRLLFSCILMQSYRSGRCRLRIEGFTSVGRRRRGA
jgi:hypothetical protein